MVIGGAVGWGVELHGRLNRKVPENWILVLVVHQGRGGAEILASYALCDLHSVFT